jgi:hypothetical protein
MGIFDLTIKKDAINQTKIEVKQQQKQEYKIIGSINHNRGHILYEYNKLTHELNIAKYGKIDNTISFDSTSLKNYQVIINKDCYYLEALNRANAIKKLKRKGFII